VFIRNYIAFYKTVLIVDRMKALAINSQFYLLGISILGVVVAIVVVVGMRSTAMEIIDK